MEEEEEQVSCSNAATTAAATSNSGGGTTIEDLPPDVLSLILRRLDGASLAAVGCTTSALHALAADPATWRALCLAMWPSLLALPSSSTTTASVDLDHRALFADAFPLPSSPPEPDPNSLPPPPPPHPLPTRLVSAVDLRHAGHGGGAATILSRVVETDTSSPWFLSSPFRVDALVQEAFTVTSPSSPPPSTAAAAAAATSAMSAADLELSWVLIDPSTGRALAAATRTPVAVERKWLTGDTVARFAVVLGTGNGTTGGGGVTLDAAVTCDEGRGHVREVSLRVEGADGAGVSGADGLAELAAAMAAPRRRRRVCGKVGERVRYEEFVRGKKARKEWKDRREGMLDLCCSGVGAAAFLGFLVMLAFR